MSDDTRSKYKRLYESAKARFDNMKDEQKETLAVAIDSALVYGGSALIGFLHGRKGGVPVVLGMPYDVIGAGLFTMLGFWGVSEGKAWGRHSVALGSGFGSYYVGSMFAQIGRRKRIEAKENVYPADGPYNLSAEQAAAAGVQVRPAITAGTARAGFPQHQHAHAAGWY